MAQSESLATGLMLLFLACLPVIYAIRTLIRMKPKALYPLLRVRLSDGSYMSVITI